MIRLSVPGSLLYRDMLLRVVSSSCKVFRAQSVQNAGHTSPAAEMAAAKEEFDAQLVSAVGEAFNNIAIHGYADSAPGEVIVEIDISDPDRVTVSIEDFGASFDPTKSELDVARLPETGMGLHILRSFVDDVHYEPGAPPRVAHRLTIVKRRP